MEVPWKITNYFLGLLLIGLCSAFPIGLENYAADNHTQLLTGLIGVLLTVCGVILLAGCVCCQRRNGFKEFRNDPVIASTLSLDHGLVNPITTNGEFTIFTPLSPTHHNNNVFLANEQVVGITEINHADINTQSWFDGTENDFPRTKLKYIKELGKGWFGRVVQGTAEGLNENGKEKWAPVVVRILEASASTTERAVFLNDAHIYRCGKHPNILQLLGRCLESVPLLLLQEFCQNGDLKRYLKDNSNVAESFLLSDVPLRWCCQLSSALDHLHKNGVVHPDLAARNCQIHSDLNLKLGDYGLAVTLYPEDYYQGVPAIPVRWCAPESLTFTSTTIQPKQITVESNVWSLGVTIWEIYSCGTQPYSNLRDDDVILQVLGSANVRLKRPQVSLLYSDYIYRLMQLTWSTSESRPSVNQVHLMLSDLMEVYKNTKSEAFVSLEDFDKRWNSFKPNSLTKTDNCKFELENKSVDLNDVVLSNLSSNKEDELVTRKSISLSLNNLHGSLDNLATPEMDSWLQKVATKTGDMSYVRGLSEAMKDLDNTLAMENVSSSDSSHQPSPAPETIPPVKNKVDYKLSIGSKLFNDSFNTQNCSLGESILHTSSGSETEDENWRRKVELGVYSEKVHQKSKSVTDLMVLTHIDCSESESETPLPSLDYRINYKNSRYTPKQNLENTNLTFGSEGNLLSVHDKFQEELKKLHEERRDSLLFVPESSSFNNNDKVVFNSLDDNNLSSDEETCVSNKNDNLTCTFTKANPSKVFYQQESSNANNVPRNGPEQLIEELSSPTDIQPTNQVYNVFNVTIDAKFSPVKQNLQHIICFEKPKSDAPIDNDTNVSSSEFTTNCYQVPKLSEIIQSNDKIMDFIIDKYESQEDEILNLKTDATESGSNDKELNNNVQNITINHTIENASAAHTEDYIQKEEKDQDKSKLPVVNFDVSLNQEEILPNSMTHSAVFTSTPFVKRKLQSISNDDMENKNQFSSNFNDLDNATLPNVELNYSLDTWDSFLGKSLDVSREFSSEPQSLLFLEDNVELLPELNDCVINENLTQDQSVIIAKQNEDGTFVVDKSVEDTVMINENCVPVAEESIKENVVDVTFTKEDINGTYNCLDKNDPANDPANGTYTCEDKEDDANATYNANCTYDANRTYDANGTYDVNNWEPGEGWFLHPQSSTELSGELNVNEEIESYTRFSRDDEIMAAIRNELLMKLPQAQGQTSEQVRDSDDWITEGRNEVHIKYNVYTTPLSPIPEESYSENYSQYLNSNRDDGSDSENSDWPEPYEEPKSETHNENQVQEQQNRHTPSQDSCCSNDTLFNLEELTSAANEGDLNKIVNSVSACENNLQLNKENNEVKELIEKEIVQDNIQQSNLMNENSGEIIVEDKKENCINLQLNENLNATFNIETKDINKTISEENFKQNKIEPHLATESNEDEDGVMNHENNHESTLKEKLYDITFTEQLDNLNLVNLILDDLVNNVVESTSDFICCDNKDTSASLETLNFLNNEIQHINNEASSDSKNSIKIEAAVADFLEEKSEQVQKCDLKLNGKVEQNLISSQAIEVTESDIVESTNLSFEEETQVGLENVFLVTSSDLNDKSEKLNDDNVTLIVENNPNYLTEFLNNERESNSVFGDSPYYVNANEILSTNAADDTQPDYVNAIETEDVDDYLYDTTNNIEGDADIYDALTDIRFTGPSDVQLMSTSFSESADIDEQDWDSGSDTRSSSSGEFIWKEGEHEESVKALTAAPQDVATNEKTNMEGENDESSESSDEDEGDCPEFVPSAWDKYATPTKSALRSPEKTLEKLEPQNKKSKGVWFKKQKYHCVYEYPREPESPSVNIYDLWKPVPSSLIDWDVDTCLYGVSTDSTGNCYQPNPNLYQLPNINSGMTALDDEFYISSSTRPFQALAEGISSQFFPGQNISNNWLELSIQLNENVTPDSGVEDITPASNSDELLHLVPQPKIQSLKYLAAAVLKNNQMNALKNKNLDSSLGGLRHARNKLKLDLPLSPSAFTSAKSFTIDLPEEPLIKREVPTFTTFGKSRFSVQQVDTPIGDDDKKNVSFEALPYKPRIMAVKNDKVEVVRGEASLLDSADEDSGIESSTLERQKYTNTTND